MQLLGAKTICNETAVPTLAMQRLLLAGGLLGRGSLRLDGVSLLQLLELSVDLNRLRLARYHDLEAIEVRKVRACGTLDERLSI